MDTQVIKVGAYTSDVFEKLLGPKHAKQDEADRVAETVLQQQSPHWLNLWAIAVSREVSSDTIRKLLEKIPPEKYSRMPGCWSVYLALAHNGNTLEDELRMLLKLPVEKSTENETILDRHKEAREKAKSRLPADTEERTEAGV